MIQKFEFKETEIKGLIEVTPFNADDIRGCFTKDYSKEVFEANGIKHDLAEVFYTTSYKGVIRALHFQREKQQPKLVRCIHGHVYDVVVDLRKDSPTFKKWLAFELIGEKHNEILVPAGMGDVAIFTELGRYMLAPNGALVAKAIREKVTAGTKVLIIGAGLIGLKCAEALHHLNADITVVDLADRILPSILDVRAGEIMQKHIEDKGTKFILGTSVEQFSKNSAKLTNGETVDFDILVIAVGVRPNTELVSDAGGKVEKGIITDLHQQTTIDNVYAAGDCTVSHDCSSNTDRILALLPNAFMQGEVAGKNMAGEETLYLNAIPMNAIGFYGLHIITAGSYDGDEDITEDADKEIYKKLVFKDGLLKGFILMGDVARAGIYTSMIKEQIPLTEVDLDLLRDKPQMMMFGKARREEKLAGKKH